MDAVNGRRAIEGEGTAEAAWQAWLGARARREAALADLVPPAARLVVVAPHPDDEVLACGGLLSLHAARGGRCRVLGVTDGEASHGPDPGTAADGLAAARRGERSRGLAALDLQPSRLEVHALRMADGRVQAALPALAQHLRSMLEPDDVVVTTWRWDGHPDHDATGQAAALACAGLPCRLIEAPVWMWHWARPADARVPWRRMLGLRLPATAQAAKRAALAAHRTQLDDRPGRIAPVLGEGIRLRAQREIEYFFVSGTDGRGPP